MLELQHIKKTYHVGTVETKALDDVSVAFREKEFVAILGPSGSGKTTCLNIIGGLDRYDSGDLIIKGKKTKDFKDSDWDAYRNLSLIHILAPGTNRPFSLPLTTPFSAAQATASLYQVF